MTRTGTVKYHGIEIEYSYVASPAEPGVGYYTPLVSDLEVLTFNGVDWGTMEGWLHTFVIDNIIGLCCEHAIEREMLYG